MIGLLLGWLTLLGAEAPRPDDGVVAVKGARLITVSGKDIENGTVLIRDGKIEAIGKEVKVPFDAKVIDASKRVVMPGLVEAHTYRGVDRPNERMASVPFVSTFDSINPYDLYFEDALRQGITTLLVLPGNDTMIGGRGCIVRPVGATTEQMIVAKDVALKISLKPKRGTSRMAHLAALRKELDAVKEWIAEQGKKKAGKSESKPDPKREPLVRLLKGELPAFVYCPSASDVNRAVDLAARYKFRMKLVLGKDGWKAAALITGKKLQVVLSPRLAYWETDPRSHREVRRFGAGPFAKAKLPFALQTDTLPYGSSYLWYQAATAVKYGVSRSQALRAATLWPAEFLGLGHRLGSLQKGKDANLLILTGDPLDAQTWVDRVLIEGRIVYERSKDKRLRRALEGRK